MAHLASDLWVPMSVRVEDFPALFFIFPALMFVMKLTNTNAKNVPLINTSSSRIHTLFVGKSTSVSKLVCVCVCVLRKDSGPAHSR